jgi:hypothetical protein
VSSILGVREALELLNRMRTTVRDLSTRAEKAGQESQTRISHELRLRQAVLQQQAEQLTTDLAEAEADHTAAREVEAEKFEQRKSRIGKAYQSSKEKALAAVDDRIGARKYELQKTMLQADRDRTANLSAAAAALEEFKGHLANENAALATFEEAARRSFRGYGRFTRLLAGAEAKSDPSLSPDENQLLSELRELLGKIQDERRRFRRLVFLHLFKPWPLWIFLALCEIPAAYYRWGASPGWYWRAGELTAGTLAFVQVARWLASRHAAPLAARIAADLLRARRVHDAAYQQADAHYHQNVERIREEFVQSTREVDQQLKQTLSQAGEQRVACRMASDGKASRILEINERLHRQKSARLQQAHDARMARIKRVAAQRETAETDASEARVRKFAADHDAQWQAIQTEWAATLRPMYEAIEATNGALGRLFPPWEPALLDNWRAPEEFAAAAKFGRLDVDVPQLCELGPRDSKLVLPGPARFPIQLGLFYPKDGSLLIETENEGHDEAIGALNNVILRLLANSPPGRLKFTIIDPVGLGQNFAGIMHLADYEEQLINNRIWTQSGQIEQKLADLNEHMEKVIQMYLRNEYATIAEYNEQAGVIAEKYHFLVVADFPANFTDTAIKRLLSIASTGARCGVHMLLHWDHRQPMPPDFLPDELRNNSVQVTAREKEFLLTPRPMPGVELALDPPPTPEFSTEFVHRVGKASRDSTRVEVPFAHVAPPDDQVWSQETGVELTVPIGRTGATKFQYLAVGKGTRQHGLVAGKTGSGKSTLFHVIITNLALWCSPEQVEFYLVDFKKGVEFKCYAANRLPHAKVVAIESDREFGLSVLQRLDEELKRRGDLFRQLGVQDVAGYKRAGGAEPMPRCLLLIDEFQEFFTEDDKIAQTASLLLDRIVRQGRAFGIHVLLGSQTLGGAYTVARTTLGQMVIRIALQCNEADAYLIMDENNPAPRLLSRPGEGIYNDMAGMLEGNSPFQVVWLPDDVRDLYLQKVRARADASEKAWGGPIVFEGNAPSDIRENPLLRQLLEAPALKPAPAGRVWLGAPNSIKGPTEAVFQRQSGNNLLIVGQRDEATLAMFTSGLVSLAAQYPLGGARFIFCDSTAPGTPQREYIERLVRAIPHAVTFAKPGDLPEIMKDLDAEMKKRAEDADPDSAPPVYLFIHGLQRFTKLRYEEDFSFSTTDAEAAPNPGATLNNLICEGARLGFHVIASADTYNNANRFLSRKAFSEFEMRVLFQMSATDSASLIENPKASMLGLHRALYYNQQEGYLETFRPYALPGGDWVDGAAANLARLLQAPGGGVPAR